MGNKQMGPNEVTESAIDISRKHVYILLPPSSDHMMIHLGGYNCAICHAQLSA